MENFLKIEIKKFGDILVSRPAGKEALGVILAYMKPSSDVEFVELDFTDVKVMAPSWLDEVYTGLKEHYGERVKLLPTTNQSVIKSLETILAPDDE